MGRVIAFPTRYKEPEGASLATAIRVAVAEPSEHGGQAYAGYWLAWEFPDGVERDEDTDELYLDDLTRAQFVCYFRLFGLHFVGVSDFGQLERLWKGVAYARARALLFKDDQRLFEIVASDEPQAWRDYVYAIARGDLIATQKYAESVGLRGSLLKA